MDARRKRGAGEPIMPDKDAAGENSAGESSRTLKEVGGYQLLSKIGQGGMGAVFKARQMLSLIHI